MSENDRDREGCLMIMRNPFDLPFLFEPTGFQFVDYQDSAVCGIRFYVNKINLGELANNCSGRLHHKGIIFYTVLDDCTTRDSFLYGSERLH